jgi:hypothetical protein
MGAPALVFLRIAALLQQGDVGIPANGLETRAESAWIVAAATRALPRAQILSVGGSERDSALVGVVARTLGVPYDAVVEKSRLPTCPSDSSASAARGYRIDGVTIERSSEGFTAPGARPDWYHYVVVFTRACEQASGAVVMRSRVRFDPMPDTLWSYAWKLGKVEHDPEPPPPRSPTFIERHGRLAERAITTMFWGPFAFPFLALFIGRLGGRRALAWLLGVWSVAGLALAVFGGASGLLGWFLLFVAPAGVYVGRASVGAADTPPAPLAPGRATVAFIVTYVVCIAAFFLVLFGAI